MASEYCTCRSATRGNVGTICTVCHKEIVLLQEDNDGYDNPPSPTYETIAPPPVTGANVEEADGTSSSESARSPASNTSGGQDASSALSLLGNMLANNRRSGRSDRSSKVKIDMPLFAGQKGVDPKHYFLKMKSYLAACHVH